MLCFTAGTLLRPTIQKDLVACCEPPFVFGDREDLAPVRGELSTGIRETLDQRRGFLILQDLAGSATGAAWYASTGGQWFDQDAETETDATLFKRVLPAGEDIAEAPHILTNSKLHLAAWWNPLLDNRAGPSVLAQALQASLCCVRFLFHDLLVEWPEGLSLRPVS
jgi:hypothetical protein